MFPNHSYIPISLSVKIENSPANVYEKMLIFLPTYYLDPDKIPPTENPLYDEDDGNDMNAIP